MTSEKGVEIVEAKVEEVDVRWKEEGVEGDLLQNLPLLLESANNLKVSDLNLSPHKHNKFLYFAMDDGIS